MGAAAAQAIAAAANIAVLAAIEARDKGHLTSWRELIGLTALFVPTVIGMWVFDASDQLFVLLPTFVIYACVTAATLRRLWQSQPIL
jgi:hypothetical protein